MLGSESQTVDTTEDRAAVIREVRKESYEYLKVCKPGVVSQIAYEEYPIIPISADCWVRLQQQKALEEIENIQAFAVATNDKELLNLARKRKVRMQEAMDSKLVDNDSNDRRLRRRIEPTKNA